MLKALLLAAAVAAGPANPEHPNEEAVEAYPQSNANAGATPFEGEEMLQAFHGRGSGVNQRLNLVVQVDVAQIVHVDRAEGLAGW